MNKESEMPHVAVGSDDPTSSFFPTLLPFCTFIAQWSHVRPASDNLSQRILDVSTKGGLHWFQWTNMCNNRYERMMSEISLRWRHGHFPHSQRNEIGKKWCPFITLRHLLTATQCRIIDNKGLLFPSPCREDGSTDRDFIASCHTISKLSEPGAEDAIARKCLPLVTPSLEATTRLWLSEVVCAQQDKGAGYERADPFEPFAFCLW